MDTEFAVVFETLKGVLEKNTRGLAVKADTASGYDVTGKVASPFPQHKGQPMWIAAVRLGKAYVSYHLMPVYMNPALQAMDFARVEEEDAGTGLLQFQEGAGACGAERARRTDEGFREGLEGEEMDLGG